MVLRHYASEGFVAILTQGIYPAADYEVPLVVERPNARHCAMPKKMSMEL